MKTFFLFFFLACSALAQTPTPNRTPQAVGAITAIPDSAVFSMTVGASPPAQQAIQVVTSNGQDWSSADTSPWFNTQPTTGHSGTSATLIPTATCSGYTAGTYTQTLTLSASGCTSNAQTITLNVLGVATPTPTPGPTPQTGSFPQLNLFFTAPDITSDIAGYYIFSITGGSDHVTVYDLVLNTSRAVPYPTYPTIYFAFSYNSDRILSVPSNIVRVSTLNVSTEPWSTPGADPLPTPNPYGDRGCGNACVVAPP